MTIKKQVNRPNNIDNITFIKMGYLMIWVVSADSNTCRIYHYQKQPTELTIIKEIVHPENKLKDSEITSDRPGHYQSGQTAHGTYFPHSDPKVVKIDTFSRQIADELDDARKKQKFDKLILIAAPHMNGLLLQHLNKNVKHLISHNIQKDLLHLPHLDLLEFLKTSTQFSDPF